MGRRASSHGRSCGVSRLRGTGVWVLLAMLWMPSWVAAPPVAAEGLTFELQPTVREQLRGLQDAWQGWVSAFEQGDQKAAEASLAQLRNILEFLGMEKAPDFSVAASACAVIAAEEGDVQRAAWALEAARRLDPERPETEFARATVQRLSGNYFGAVMSGGRGLLKVVRQESLRTLLLHNLGLWCMYLVIVSGLIFVAVQMVAKGGALFYDLVRLISPPLPPAAADALVVVALIWPILLPSGWLWLALYWSVLIWGYGSIGERVVFVVLWLALGGIPIGLAYQQRGVQLAQMPPSRLMESLESHRLYGEIFSDLEVMRRIWSDDSMVLELTADLHRRFGQWEEARAIYSAIASDPDLNPKETVPALNNLGVYHLRQREAEVALGYFERAAEADPSSAAAAFNTAEAYSQLFDFPKSNEALSRATRLDREKVDAWNAVKADAEESGVEVEGGLMRSREVRQEMKNLWRAEDSGSLIDLWRRNMSLTVALVAALLAMAFHMVRSQIGYRSRVSGQIFDQKLSKVWRVLVPGLASIRKGKGVQALLGIMLPVGVLLVPMMQFLGFRLPLGLGLGSWIPLASSLVGLISILLIRLGWSLSAEDG